MTPKRFPDTVPLEAVRAEAEKLEPGAEADTSVRVAGRVLGRREMGKLVFLDLVDRSGRIQLLCDTSRTGVTTLTPAASNSFIFASRSANEKPM